MITAISGWEKKVARSRNDALRSCFASTMKVRTLRRLILSHSATMEIFNRNGLPCCRTSLVSDPIKMDERIEEPAALT